MNGARRIAYMKDPEAKLSNSGMKKGGKVHAGWKTGKQPPQPMAPRVTNPMMSNPVFAGGAPLPQNPPAPMPGMKEGGWMKNAVKRPGAFAAKAKKAGMSTAEFADKKAHSKNPTLRKEAVLAKTFAKFRKK